MCETTGPAVLLSTYSQMTMITLYYSALLMAAVTHPRRSFHLGKRVFLANNYEQRDASHPGRKQRVFEAFKG